MDRRKFLSNGGQLILASAIAHGIPVGGASRLLAAAETTGDVANPNWADRHNKATATASSYVDDPPWGYHPSNVFGSNLHNGWEAKHQASGAWLEITFPEARPVREVWILPHTLPYDIVGQDPYMMTYSRARLLEAPRRVRCSVAGGLAVTRELSQTYDDQIITFPRTAETQFVRITVEDVWTKPGGEETGLAKVRVYPHRHDLNFEIDVYSMYDVHNGTCVQAATLHLVNPGEEIRGAKLTASHQGKMLTEVALSPIPSRAASHQDIWIPAPFVDTAITFELRAGEKGMGRLRTLRVPAYHSHFDHGIFALNCTCHNDLGWLNTQKKTADYRSEEIILPAMKLLAEYPEFRYSMESTAYLMEFLERHPEKREEMARTMREKRFVWGASFVQCQEAHVGPEKLVRQFYFGRRWLKETFPGVDTQFYVKTDPPGMTLQMPQILKRAGVKYIIQGRLPYGFYNWESPDGSILLTYGYHYASPMRLLDPKGDQGWLHYARERASYYASHDLPRMFIYDYTSDYLPPQPALPPYTRGQNEAMKRFAAKWNEHFAAQPEEQIHPPRMVFVEPEGFLDEFTGHPLDITTLRGDWPFSWAYYDEPGNREGLLLGREAHNELLATERLLSGIGESAGFAEYPEATLREAWKANCWPDHGWGGNRGIVTDSVYVASYAKSKRLADNLLGGAGARLAGNIRTPSSKQVPLVVFNPASWLRTDLAEFEFALPDGWQGLTIRDDNGREVPFEKMTAAGSARAGKFAFVAPDVPSVGYRTFYLEQGPSFGPAEALLSGEKAENDFFRLTFGAGGIKSLYDKRKKWDVLRTEKFEGGEILQFTAPGNAWEDPEIVTMQNFDKTSNHAFAFQRFVRGAIRTTALREARFQHFTLRERFHLYHQLDRVDLEVELVDWDGTKARELRVAFPMNLEDACLSYEVPFGTVELGKDELDFTQLPSNIDSQFQPAIYGGDHPLAYREAINWIDASARRYQGRGCMAASDMTVHLFRDETANPVAYPVLQHVLLSTRKSLAWNPVYWFTQKGTHRYRMALMPHEGDWRLRYREAIGFNYRLTAFVGSVAETFGGASVPPRAEFLNLEPANLVLTAMKKAEGSDNQIVIRFYEAEGNKTSARIKLAKPIRKAWRASLIEYDEGPIDPTPEGSLEFTVKPWEIVTIKLAV
ncbi:MAG TPA: glycosyl hydrolase-related protein [Terriglobia bacterium]|nr:glycosyl hydrolase-related protein [Terriglobia bacterium]